MNTPTEAPMAPCDPSLPMLDPALPDARSVALLGTLCHPNLELAGRVLLRARHKGRLPQQRKARRLRA